ncbi:hypothetical protein BUE80_DR004373 [Diplocarpon rosae]|nr:hypothetical protein BUE80_DR004373 [Diplocarpon rosae]
MSVQVVAIITPAPGKESRIKELLAGLADNVAKNESKVSKYQVFEQYGGENSNSIIVEETYADQATFDAHFKTDYFSALGKTIQNEGLLGAPLDIKTIKPFAGFASR